MWGEHSQVLELSLFHRDNAAGCYFIKCVLFSSLVVSLLMALGYNSVYTVYIYIYISTI